MQAAAEKLNDSRPSTLIEFDKAWARSTELRDALASVSDEMSARLGVSGRISSLMNRWDNLRIPKLSDRSLDESIVHDIKKWIKDCESVISYTIRMSKSGDSKNTDDENRGEVELIKDISESGFDSDKWSWPWVHKVSTPKKNNTKDPRQKRGSIIKYGAVSVFCAAAIAAVALDGDSGEE